MAVITCRRTPPSGSSQPNDKIDWNSSLFDDGFVQQKSTVQISLSTDRSQGFPRRRYVYPFQNLPEQVAEITAVASDKDAYFPLYGCGKDWRVLPGQGQPRCPDDPLWMRFRKNGNLLHEPGQVRELIRRLFLNISQRLFLGKSGCKKEAFACRGQSEQSP